MTKECNKCGNVKEDFDFHKKTSAPDGLQTQCKSCVKDSNKLFRTVKPEYGTAWLKTNSKRWLSYMLRYQKADKTPKIYSITNPNGYVYIGMTMMHAKVRWQEHRKHYRRVDRPRIPLLHKSFEIFGIKNHQFNVLAEIPGIDRKQLRFIEKSFIEVYKKENKSLNTLK